MCMWRRKTTWWEHVGFNTTPGLERIFLEGFHILNSHDIIYMCLSLFFLLEKRGKEMRFLFFTKQWQTNVGMFICDYSKTRDDRKERVECFGIESIDAECGKWRQRLRLNEPLNVSRPMSTDLFISTVTHRPLEELNVNQSCHISREFDGYASRPLWLETFRTGYWSHFLPELHNK